MKRVTSEAMAKRACTWIVVASNMIAAAVAYDAHLSVPTRPSRSGELSHMAVKAPGTGLGWGRVGSRREA